MDSIDRCSILLKDYNDLVCMQIEQSNPHNVFNRERFPNLKHYVICNISPRTVRSLVPPYPFPILKSDI
jgi:hypothetical protein